MATANIRHDQSKNIIRELIGGMMDMRNGAFRLENARASLIQARDGDGSDASHYAPLVALGCYPTNAEAKASFDEMDSQYGTVATHAAIGQCCAKHGV